MIGRLYVETLKSTFETRGRHLELRVLVIVPVLVILPAACRKQWSQPVEKPAQTKTQLSQGQEGQIAGRIVLIVRGDERAAASASVVIMDAEGGQEFLGQLEKETEKRCGQRLVDMATAALEMAKTAQGGGRHTFLGETDGDGYFQASHVPPGTYVIVAYGRAGGSHAMWTRPVIVGAGQPALVKLASPLLACSDTPEKPGQ